MPGTVTFSQSTPDPRPRRCQLRALAGLGSAILLAATAARGADWPQYRGPNHDGIAPGRITKQWPANGPRRLWQVPVTDGFSSFSVSGSQAFTLVKRPVNGQPREVCLALDAANGAENWATPVGPAVYDSGGDTEGGGDGPRSTPAVQDGRVYVLSAYLALFCLDATDGHVIWSRDLLADYQGRVILWQNAASPLVEGGLVFVNCNGAVNKLLALRADDGTEVWNTQNRGMTHATPIAATLHNQRQIIFLTDRGLQAVDPLTGTLLWEFYAYFGTLPAAASPVAWNDLVYFSVGYNIGARCVRVSRNGDNFTATLLWSRTGSENPGLQNIWSTPVCHDGYLYGLFGYKLYADGPLKCVEMATGRELWSQPGFGHGGLLLADGHLLILDVRGNLILAEATPAAYREVARHPAVTGKCWNVPALADGRLYARSVAEATCLDLALPDLKWLSPQWAGHRLRLPLATQTGAPIDGSRAAGVEIWAGADPTTDPLQWRKLTNGLVFTNGAWEVETSTVDPRNYYIAVEPP